MCHVGISLPPDVRLNERPSRAPNCCPFKLVKVNNDIYVYSFYPRTIALCGTVSEGPSQKHILAHFSNHKTGS